MSAASARRVAACASASALMTFARRSRSASACLAIARCIADGMPTSRISTVVTLIPQGSVCSSMICWRCSLSCSRWDSSASRSALPSTARSVVWAIIEVAWRKFSISTTEERGSTTRKYATASTRAGTLSQVITSCAGMLSVWVRSETRTIRSISGTSSTTPGPLAPISRPSRNTTARSYSRRIRTEAAAAAVTASTSRTSNDSRTAVMAPPPIPPQGAR